MACVALPRAECDCTLYPFPGGEGGVARQHKGLLLIVRHCEAVVLGYDGVICMICMQISACISACRS